MTVSKRIADAGWLYAPKMDRGGAPVYGWYGNGKEYATRRDVADSIGATEAEVQYEENRLDREAERCYDRSLPTIPTK